MAAEEGRVQSEVQQACPHGAAKPECLMHGLRKAQWLGCRAPYRARAYPRAEQFFTDLADAGRHAIMRGGEDHLASLLSRPAVLSHTMQLSLFYGIAATRQIHADLPC